ncbi:hypothetical protein ABD76_06780 [Paenibacillus dendritiformis]|uniref:stalk domain-containing protein n=1 Tax=Paenibacillus dendritiformis TaxID=130049 RepID=UPI0018CD86D6|nr:stalk domain-containing protein [Paenibacillus dendritiformis]MBG9792221.1 hypothetical protein [Paenibacillus dendritiformis]
MRKFFACAIIIFLVSNLAVAVKAEVPKGQKVSDGVLKSDVALRVNNNVVEVDEESPLLHYKGRTYLPLRAVARVMGGWVSYDPRTKRIDIDHQPMKTMKSSKNARTRKGDFTLSLYSSKTVYKTGEPIDIWSTLQYEGDERIEIIHPNRMILYSIRDEAGQATDDETQVAGKHTVFEPGDIVLDVLDSFHLVKYNFLYNRDTAPDPGVDDPFSDNVRRAFLPAGKYRILAYTSSLEEEGAGEKLDELRVELEIEVRE